MPTPVRGSVPRPESLVSVEFEVVGDSAVPVYYDGEDVPVEVKGRTQEFEQDTVYVFRYQKKDVMIKRLRRLDDDRIRAQSLNPGIDDQILYHHEHDFAILGRVIDNKKQQLYTSLVNRFLRRGNQQLPALE
jgi:phage repressor protein C with HTH and peptisase S24 domain